MMKGRSILKYLLYFLNLCAVGGLVVAYLAGHISPDQNWLPAFFGLSYPIILTINILFVIFWLITWKKFVFVSLAAILAGYTNLQAIYPVRFSGAVQVPAERTKLVSFNVHSLYGKDPSDSKQKTKNRVTDFLVSQKADIICIQEFYAIGEDFSQTLEKFAGSIHLDYYAFKNYREFDNKKKINALATFSRYPILQSGVLRLPGRSHFAIYCDMVIHSDTVRVYNIHLESIRFGNEDYLFYSKLTDPEEEEITPIREGSKRLLWKLRKAFIFRSKQVKLLTAHIKTCNYPVILAGDFNDTPSSYAYTQLTKQLTDSFVESGNGLFQTTYAGKFPSFRIDYILHSDEFKSFAYRNFKLDISDHYPVSTYLVKIP